jgi:hypothetical protein
MFVMSRKKTFQKISCLKKESTVQVHIRKAKKIQLKKVENRRSELIFKENIVNQNVQYIQAKIFLAILYGPPNLGLITVPLPPLLTPKVIFLPLPKYADITLKTSPLFRCFPFSFQILFPSLSSFFSITFLGFVSSRFQYPPPPPKKKIHQLIYSPSPRIFLSLGGRDTPEKSGKRRKIVKKY